MQQNDVPSFEELLDSAKESAVHLEMRDHYAVGEEADVVEAWRRSGEVPAYDSAYWQQWVPLVERTVGRGVTMRRARVVSEPVTDYIRFEHAITPANLRAGEDVRWLSRRRSVDLALPGADFWLIDNRMVRFNIFTGDGVAVEPEASDDPEVAALCAAGFEAVWERAIPHAHFTLI